MKKIKHNFYQRGEGKIGVLFLVVLALVGWGVISHIGATNQGEHTGYVTAVEQEGLIWKTWRAYIKTDPQSSQEDSYCIKDPAIVAGLQAIEKDRTLVTINYSSPLLVFKWECGGESSIISSIPAYVQKQADTPQSNGSGSQPLITPSNNPASYVGEVSQTGGISSRVVNIHVVSKESYDMGGWLIPAKDFVWTRFNSPPQSYFEGQPKWMGSSVVMIVGCKDGYKVTDALSSTNNQIDTFLMGVPGSGVGMEIVDKSPNIIQITCEKQ